MEQAQSYAQSFLELLETQGILWEIETNAQLAALFDCYAAGTLQNTSPLSRLLLNLDDVIDTARQIVMQSDLV